MSADQAATKAQLERMLDSKSWRWTKWLRSLEWWLRRGKTVELMRPRIAPTKLSVVIPIFNAFDHVVRCVDSVLLHTDIDGVRILLIDDASTDEKMTTYLSNVERFHPHRVHVVRHKKNLGFLRSANVGFALSPHSDVILLNSDTIVGPHWAASLQDAAARDSSIASVTALSNNASIYSVLQDRFLETPDPRQVDLLAEQVHRTPGAVRPKIPTGVGFCLFMTKQALEEVGGFDEAFHPGYGEENDWCQRAAKKGFHHILDDRCFVYHVGHASMSEAGTLPKGASTIESHERLLEERHPDYVSRVRGYLKSGIQCQVASRIDRVCPPGFPARRMRIAFLLHQPLSSAARGGTERHVLDVIRELKDACDCTVISPNRGSFVALRFHDSLSLRYELEYERKDESKRRVLLELLRHLESDIIHVEHTEGYGFDVLSDLHSLGKKIVYSIHDSHATHTVPHPIVTDGPSASRRSSSEIEGIARHLRHVAHVVAPSEEALENFVACYPDVRERSSVIEHGLHIGMRVPAPASNRPTVCFLGEVSSIRKGHSIIESLVPKLVERGIAVTFLGTHEREFPSLTPSPLLRFCGSYDPEEVTMLLRREAPTVVVLLSLFPETFSYTLHEAVAAGMPVFTTPVGVFPRKVRDMKVGKVSSSFDPDAIFTELMNYLSSEQLQGDAKNTLTAFITTRRGMAVEYFELYRTLLSM